MASKTQINEGNWPKYLVIQDVNQTESSILSLSPFAIAKGIEGIAGEPKTVKKLRDGILVEVTKKSHSDNLLKCGTFVNHPVTVSPHRTLNSSKGVIRCRELKGMTEEDICNEMAAQSVTNVYRIKINRGKQATDTYILTFNAPNIPTSVKIGYMNVKCSMYIPNPLRCYNCQNYGHGSSKCNQPQRCSRCGDDHGHETCTVAEPMCLHCSANHATSDKHCPRFLKEKAVVEIKYRENISFPEARRKVESLTSTSSASVATSYAAATQKNTILTVKTRSIAVQTELSWPEKSQVPLKNSNDASTSTAVNTAPIQQKTLAASSSSKTDVTKPLLKEPHQDCNTKTKPKQTHALSPGHDANIKLANKYDALASNLTEIGPTPPKKKTGNGGLNPGVKKAPLNRNSIK